MAAVVHRIKPFLRVGGVFYGWRLAGFSLLLIAIVSGPIWSSVGVWVKALELHFGWSRTQLTGAFSLSQLEGSIVGPLAGYFTDRLGSRRMVVIGLALVGSGFIIFSLTTNLPLFYLSFSIIMLGAGMGTWLPMMAALNKWFIRRRSTAMAIAGEGYFLGGVVLVPVLAWAVAPDSFGWQTTARWIGVLFLVAAWPASRLIRDRPQDYGLYPDGALPPDPSVKRDTGRTGGATETGPGFTARQAMRTSAFWFISFGHALSTMLIATLTVHLVPMLTDQGLSFQMAAYVWSAIMAVGAVSALLGGYVGDRVRKTVAIFVFVTI